MTEIIVIAMSKHPQSIYTSLSYLLNPCYVAGVILGTGSTKKGQARFSWLMDPAVLGLGFRNSAVMTGKVRDIQGHMKASPTQAWGLREGILEGVVSQRKPDMC